MIPRTKRYGNLPGDQRRVTMESSTSRDGRKWPSGTVVVPLCGGYDNPSRASYAEVTIHGESVTFDGGRTLS